MNIATCARNGNPAPVAIHPTGGPHAAEKSANDDTMYCGVQCRVKWSMAEADVAETGPALQALKNLGAPKLVARRRAHRSSPDRNMHCESPDARESP